MRFKPAETANSQPTIGVGKLGAAKFMLTKNEDQITEGGPAFPHKPMKWDSDADAYVPDHDFHGHGMSLRDYFAAKALVGLLAAHEGNFTYQQGQLDLTDFAQDAYFLADTMIKARKN